MRLLGRSELREATVTLAMAFDEDPLFRFMLPRQPRRRKWLELIMARALHDSLPAQLVCCPDDGPELGIASWFPPGAYPPAPGRGRGFWFGGERPPLAWPTWPLMRRGPRSLRAMARAHAAQPHYYLQCLGVRPDAKGRGLGRALLEHGLARADADGVAAYLETSNEVNLGFYRRFGFDVDQELDPGGGAPPIWTMLRAPA